MSGPETGAAAPVTSRAPLRRLAPVLVLLLIAAACSSGADRDSADTTPVTTQPPGTLLADPTEFHGYPALESVTQRTVAVRYQSTSGIDNSATEVTGLVFVPRGDPPAGGWPIVSIGHATTGSSSRCAPSTHIGLLGNLPTVIPFLANGYVVAMTDYQGLGTQGPHPYLEPVTAGFNVIDAVRAAREVEPNTSDTWLGYGVSQGGQAVWSANELSGDYGQGLNLLGSISVSPATDLEPFVDAMVGGTLTPSQITALPSLLRGVQVAHPELDLDDYLHGTLAARVDTFTTCIGEKAQLQADIAESTPASDYEPSSPEAADKLREWLSGYSVPRTRAQQPMLIAYGDQDELIAPAWTQDAVRQGCAAGDVIDLVVAPGQGHGILNIGPATSSWVDGRFAGTPPPNTCGS
ncbi:lipase family protein [Rhodococcoides kyotonense]|uniref:Secretory lipase n=1 Tax=Rhodococcoides kyotonense TaxID=398843 RepID=A0A239H9Z0_9NOCA|nr:lipase family protein [Rhodococcus kyotonensis]SNS78177.1 Secretory lipase [Rhodococcus kyotonensis]